MSQDELDQLFGEEFESSVEAEDEELAISKLSGSEIEEDYDDEQLEINYKKNSIHTSTLTTETTSITLPTINRPSNEGFIPYILKLPRFIGCKRATYEGESSLRDELIETEFVDYGDLLRARTTIRNRKLSKKENGMEGIESNSRLNRWSDGTWTLQIGREHFEVLPQVFSADENNLLFVRHQNEGCLESVGKLANKLTVRPFMDSQGTHRKYLSLAEATGKGMKKVKVRVATTTVDPEKEKRGLVKIQQERIKARRKLDAKRRNLEQKSFDRVGKEGLTARFLEAEEELEEDDENDEYDADFIDDAEIEETEDAEIEDEEEEEIEKSIKTSKAKDIEDSRSRTSRLIFDDDDEDE